MRIIISPAKQMRVDTDSFSCSTLPVFMEKTEILMQWIRSLSYEEQKKLWVCNDKIARQNAERFAHMDLRKNLTPALLSYDGIQYTYMAPAVFEDGQYDYVQEHLRILSGFYGVVKPMDGVVPYRLEMQAKATFARYKNLYDFWGDSLYHEVVDDSRIIINLASKEYSKCIEKYLQSGGRYITCIFGELEGEKVVQKGVYAKMARGEMVRYMAGIQAEEPEQMKNFNWSGYHFDEDRSSEAEYVFIRTEVPGRSGGRYPN
ncbi:MAG: peroxide stress protein YaaA [Parasporobacterium sp.]|nr:peroxide stress protein YaaA [Parasporobacterium sp.]